MRYEFDYEYSDGLIRAASNRSLRTAIGWRVPLTFVLILALLVPICADGGSEYVCGLFHGALIMLAFLLVVGNLQRRAAALRFARKLPTRAARCIVSDESLTVENAFATSVLRWPIVRRVVRGPDVWLFFLARAQMFGLPADKIGADIGAFIEDRVTAAGGKLK